MIPAITRSSVVLPEPFRPIRPTASPGAISAETSRSAHTSVACGPAALDDEILERARVSCVHAKAARDAVDGDLADFHAA